MAVQRASNAVTVDFPDCREHKSSERMGRSRKSFACHASGLSPQSIANNIGSSARLRSVAIMRLTPAWLRLRLSWPLCFLCDAERVRLPDGRLDMEPRLSLVRRAWRRIPVRQE